MAGTCFWDDPQEKLVAIWLMQAPEQCAYYRQLYHKLVYAALDYLPDRKAFTPPLFIGGRRDFAKR